MNSGSNWSVPERLAEHRVQRSFLIDRASGPVPGTVWTPADMQSPLPLVLMGHGGSGHRISERMQYMAQRLTRLGIAAAAIDLPYRGDRVATSLTTTEYQARIASEGIEQALDRTTEDWRATCELLGDTGIADTTKVAYFGLSMGTRFGLGISAALGPALRCAVFGKFGTVSEIPALIPLNAPDLVLRDASRITSPVFFHVSWDDELFPRQGQLRLFEGLASEIKELHAFSGAHAHTPEQSPAMWLSFIGRHLDIPKCGTGW